MMKIHCRAGRRGLGFVLLFGVFSVVLGLNAVVLAEEGSGGEEVSGHDADGDDGDADGDDGDGDGDDGDDGDDDGDVSVVVPMVFPVDGEHGFVNGWHDPRDGGARLHEGIDIVAERHSLLVATVDGVIETVRHSNSGRAGNMVVLRGDDGNRFFYIHLNNDEPGTDNGVNLAEQAFAAGIAEGVRVSAGDPIGFVGDSGNAESTVPHLHFGLKTVAGETVNPYWSLVGADGEGQTSRVFGELAVTGPGSTGYVVVGVILLVVGVFLVTASTRLVRPRSQPAALNN